MNRLFTIITFFLINCGLSSAQKADVYDVPLEIDLRVVPTGRLFSVDTIINARVDTVTHIGTWQQPSGKIVELRFTEGFQPTLTNFIFSTLTNFDNKLPFYSIAVRDFTINSARGFNRFELAVTFCKRNAYQLGSAAVDTTISGVHALAPVFNADIIVESSGTDFSSLVKEGLTKLFLKFNNYLTNTETVPSNYSDLLAEMTKSAQELNLTQAVYDSSHTTIDDDLLRCNQLRSGVYRTFNDLRLNRPSLTGQLSIQEKNGFASLRKSSGSRAKYRFFGFCDGRDLFISTNIYPTAGIRYAKVKSVGRYLLWIDNYVTSSERTASAVGASFGLIGALAASSATSYKDCIALDMQTGGVFMVTKDKLPQMLAGHDDLLAELAAMPNPKDEQKQFYLLDKLNQRVRSQVTR
ncbi:DUF6563 family protein [Spirosoma validum]|uniref:Uncharacterized protein n=1 Tax=Spirosoma validum TaxID=2771355 RepID=A0A927B7V3_9BACT|nr:DUF6563 family protein [Spirosoma validum]MBD2757325.1 hypothetical protein [Spirosoma validum]